jgi:hypothetical protein
MSATPVVASSVNEEMANILMKAISDANLPGFDYLEFKDAIAKMSNAPMTEQQRFVAVFSTAQVMGVKYVDLIASIDHYVSVVGKQRESFMANVDQVVKEQVDSRLESITGSEKKIADALAKIAELNEFVVKTQQEMLNLKNEVAQSQQQIDNTRSSFEATFNMVVGRLNEDKTKMTTYLGSMQ